MDSVPRRQTSPVLSFGGLRPIDTLSRILGILAALVLPGLGPAFLLRPRPHWPLFLGRAFLWGPFVAGLIMTILDLLGLRSWLSIVFPLVGAALLVIAFIVGAWREDKESPEEGPWEGGDKPQSDPHHDEPDPKAVAENRGLTLAFMIGAILALIVILPPLFRPWISERGDSWFHAAIFEEILHHGVPPEDPYFAGVKLQYMWFFHEILVGLHLLTKASPFTIMVVLNAIVLVGLCVMAADLARSLWRDPRSIAGAALITPLGLGALFWVFFPLRALKALFGGTGGMEHLTEAFRLAPFDIPATRAYLSDLGSSPFFLNKFLVGNAYGLALAFMLAYLISLVRYVDTGRRSFLITAGVELFAILILHPVAGFTTLAVSGFTGLALLIPVFRHPRIGFKRVAAWGIVAAAALALAAPYLRSVTQGKPSEQLLPFHLGLDVLLGIVVGCLFVLAAAIGPLRDLWRRAEPGGRLFVLWIPAVFLFSTIIRLPGPNTTDKFTFLVYLPLAVAAGAWAGGAFRGGRGVVLAILILVPANAIGYLGYWFDAALPTESAEVREAYDWIRANTSPDAVIVEKEGRKELLVRGPRRLYFASESYAEQWGYALGEVEKRRGVQAQIFDGRNDEDPRSFRMTSSLVALTLSNLNRDVDIFVVLRSEELGQDGTMRFFTDLAHFRPVFTNSSIQIYQVHQSF